MSEPPEPGEPVPPRSQAQESPTRQPPRPAGTR